MLLMGKGTSLLWNGTNAFTETSEHRLQLPLQPKPRPSMATPGTYAPPYPAALQNYDCSSKRCTLPAAACRHSSRCTSSTRVHATRIQPRGKSPATPPPQPAASLPGNQAPPVPAHSDSPCGPLKRMPHSSNPKSSNSCSSR